MKILLLLILTCTPQTIICPIDGAIVGWTGHMRDRDGKLECQYVHAWIHSRHSLLVDERHELWAPCEVK